MAHLLNKIRLSKSYIKHPFGVTCFDCGFLAMGNDEVIKSERILLHCEGHAGCPPVDNIHCFRSLWVDRDLGHVSAGADGVFQEIKKQRRHCEGFFKYKPSWSPKEHQDLLLKSEEKKARILVCVVSAATGIAGTLIFQYLKKLLDI